MPPFDPKKLYFTVDNNGITDYVRGDDFCIGLVEKDEIGEYSNALSCSPPNDSEALVAKKLRVPYAKTDEIKSRLHSDLENHFDSLQNLTHPRIVPFRMFCLDSVTNLPIILVPRFPEGNIISYLSHRVADEGYSQLLICLISEALEGLNFAHQNNMVHGNFRGSNILITSDGHAVVSDFGINAIIRGTSPLHGLPASVNWMPPEHVGPDAPDDTDDDTDDDTVAPNTVNAVAPTKQSDIYSFGRTVEEIYTLQVPFFSAKGGNRIRSFVRLARRLQQAPTRIPEIPTEVWENVETCFAVLPEDRPTSDTLLRKFQEL